MENLKRKMENSSTVPGRKEGLGVLQIIKESLKIPIKNPNFILFSFFTSLPLFSLLVSYEVILQHVLIETGQVLWKTGDPAFIKVFGNDYEKVEKIEDAIAKVYLKVLVLGFFYLGIIHLMDLFNTIATVDVASIIYAGDRHIRLKDMLCRPVKETRFKGPLITSFCSLALACLILLGLLFYATLIFITSADVVFILLFVVPFIALLAKNIEWSAIWDMGIVISILEEKQVDVALIFSSYLTRCNRAGGFFLMLGFLGWRLALRFLCLYQGWDNGGSSIVITVAHIGLVCMANLLKWVAITIYFYDCKKQSSYKHTDLEDGKVQE